MSPQKHTPGPWRYSGHPEETYPFRAEDDTAVNHTHPANARLIAEAPKLLEALEALIRWHEDNRAPDDAWSQARAAIQKATGEGP